MLINDENKWLTAAFIVSFLAIFLSFLAIPLLLKFICSSFPSFPEEYKVLTGTIPHQLLMLGSVPMVCLFMDSGRSPFEIMGLKNWKLSYVFYAFIIELILSPAMALITISSGFLLTKSGITVSPPPVIELIINCKWESAWIIAFGAVILAPLSEEIIFRRVFYGFLSARTGPIAAAVTVSALFAGIHQSIVQFPALFLLGLILQFLYVRFNSLYPAILLHAMHNSVSVAIFFLFKLLNLHFTG